VPRIDKIAFSFRAPAGTALPGGVVTGVMLNAGGSVIPSGTAAGNGAVGVVCPGGTIAAGRIISVLVKGEIVDFGGTVSGTYYAGTAATVDTTSTNGVAVGFTVEADRLIVSM